MQPFLRKTSLFRWFMPSDEECKTRIFFVVSTITCPRTGSVHKVARRPIFLLLFFFCCFVLFCFVLALAHPPTYMIHCTVHCNEFAYQRRHQSTAVVCVFWCVLLGQRFQNTPYSHRHLYLSSSFSLFFLLFFLKTWLCGADTQRVLYTSPKRLFF